MATRGFEWAYNLDGTKGGPVIRDFILSTATAHKIGDLMTIESDGDISAAAATDSEFTCVMQEAVAAADITAGTTTAKAAIVNSNQVWRCSTDASTAATALVGTIKTWDLVDANTIDADEVAAGYMTIVETPSQLDDDGNVIGYVCFTDTTFGNA